MSEIEMNTNERDKQDTEQEEEINSVDITGYDSMTGYEEPPLETTNQNKDWYERHSNYNGLV